MKKNEDELMLADLHPDELVRYGIRGGDFQLCKKCPTKPNPLRPPDNILEALKESEFKMHRDIYEYFKE